MSLPLIDLRTKITHETNAVLEAVHQSTGKDRTEIAREVLHQWAAKEIHAANLLSNMLEREGIAGRRRA